MSQAIFTPPPGLPTLGEGVEYNPTSRRKSLNPVAMADNYKRRLSLAVPQATYGRRGVSMGNVLKGMDSPARRRLRLKRWATSESSDTSKEAPASPTSSTQRNPRRVAFVATSPSSPSMVSEALDIIAEHSDEGENGANKADKADDTVTDTKSHSKVKKHDKGGGSLKLRKTAFSDVVNEVSPSSRLSSSSSSASCPSPDKGDIDLTNGRLQRSSSTGSSRTRSSDRGIRFVPGKDSPSIAHRKKLQRSSTASDPEERNTQDFELQDDKTERVGSLRKNISYTKALSREGLE